MGHTVGLRCQRSTECVAAFHFAREGRQQRANTMAETPTFKSRKPSTQQQAQHGDFKRWRGIQYTYQKNVQFVLKHHNNNQSSTLARSKGKSIERRSSVRRHLARQGYVTLSEEEQEGLFFSWCFEPSQPQGVTSGLNTNSIS